MICRSCGISFEGRPNRQYCSPKCRRRAEMTQRIVKKRERYQALRAAMGQQEKAFYDTIREFSTEGLQEFSTNDLKEFPMDELKEFPIEDLKEFEINPPEKGKKRGQKR